MKEPKNNFTLCQFMTDKFEQMISLEYLSFHFCTCHQTLVQVAEISIREFDLIVIEIQGKQMQFKSVDDFVLFIDTFKGKSL